MGLILEDMDQLLVPRLNIPLEDEIANLVVAAKQLRAASVNGLRQAEERLAQEIGLSPEPPLEPLSYSHSSSLVLAEGRLDSQYFMPAKTEMIRALATLPGATLGDVYDSVRDMVDPTKHFSRERARQFDVTHALEPVLDDEQELVDFEELGSTKKRMRKHDVVISRLRVRTAEQE